MPSSLAFNGSVMYLPGGATQIIADQLNGVTLGAAGTVALIGEAEGGKPGLIRVSSPSAAAAALGSGKLVDAANQVFSPSNDPLVPGGASDVYLYKTNASTQSTVSLPGPAATREVSSSATGGTGTTLVDSTLSATTVDNQFNGMWLIVRPNAATQEIKAVTGYTASTGTFTVGSAWSVNPSASDAYLVLSNNVTFVGEVDTGSTTTSVPVLAAAFTADEHKGRWVRITSASGPVQLRQITANSTTALTVSPALPAAPVSGTSYIEILPKALTLTSKGYGIAENGISVDFETLGSGAKRITVFKNGLSEVSPSLGGFPFLKLLFKGAGTSVSTTVNNSPAATTTSIPVVTTLVAGAQVGKQVLIDGEYTVITANTTTSITVSPALSAAPVAGTAVTILATSRAVGSITGSAGVATGLVTSTGVVGADLNISFTSGQTLRNLVDTINQNSNYVAVIPSGINADTTLAKDFDFGPKTQISLLVSAGLTTSGFKQDENQVVLYLAQSSAYVTAVRGVGGAFDGAAVPGDVVDPVFLAGAVRGASTNSSFQAGFDAVLGVRANVVVPLISQDLVNEGNGSTATVASVIAQAKDHVVAARGSVGSERCAVVGFQGTKAQIIAQANAVNDIDVQLVPQSPTLVNSAGSLQVFGPEMLAALIAGMRCGVSSVGEPLTNKLVKVSALSQDSTWDPNDLTDANDMVRAGVLFARTDDTNTIRICRDLTTWVADNNLANSEGSVRDVVRFVAYNLRKTLTDRYVGRKNAPATLRNIKSTAVTYLEGARSQQIIVDTTDLATGAPLRAYHNLKVSAVGDTVTVEVCICPVPGINFVINIITLVPFVQSF